MYNFNFIDNIQVLNKEFIDYNKENINLINIDKNLNQKSQSILNGLTSQYQQKVESQSNKENFYNNGINKNYKIRDYHLVTNLPSNTEKISFSDAINIKYIETSKNAKSFVNITNSLADRNNKKIYLIEDYSNGDKYTNTNANAIALDNAITIESQSEIIENKENKFQIGLETKNEKESHNSKIYHLAKTNKLIPLYLKFTNQIPHDYLLEIWGTLKSDELNNAPNYLNIQSQKDINEKMRAILIDWLVEVHARFLLTTETLFLTVNIIDRYLSKKQVLRSHLQLIGVASLFIACKYEEILCPDLKDFVYVTDKTYNKQEILNAETEILRTLNFDITIATSFRFFEIISLNFNFNDVEFTYGKYLLEYYLIDYRLNKYCPSLISLAVAYIIMKMNNYKNYNDLYTLFNKNDPNSNSKTLKECAKEIYYLVQNSTLLSFKAVLKKYSSQEYHKVAVNGMEMC